MYESLYINIHILMYIYIERERDRERYKVLVEELGRERATEVTLIYIM